MAHARRKFFEALGSSPKQASRMLALIQQLYRINRQERAAGITPSQRAERSRPIFERIEKELEELSTTVLPKSLLGKAVMYMRRQWRALQRYMEDDRLAIDNNGAEGALRGVAVGRKNWLFTGSLAGGRRAAVIYSLMETCKRNGVEPFEYLHDVLRRLPRTASQDMRELLPGNWKAAREASAVAAITH